MLCRSTFLATNTAEDRRVEKRQFCKPQSILKRAELLDTIKFCKKQHARSFKDRCTHWRYKYQGWSNVTDETRQHEVVCWQVSLSMESVKAGKIASHLNLQRAEAEAQE